MQNQRLLTVQQKQNNLIELGHALQRLRDSLKTLSLALKDYQCEVDTKVRATARQELDHIVQKLRKSPSASPH